MKNEQQTSDGKVFLDYVKIIFKLILKGIKYLYIFTQAIIPIVTLLIILNIDTNTKVASVNSSFIRQETNRLQHIENYVRETFINSFK